MSLAQIDVPTRPPAPRPALFASPVLDGESACLCAWERIRTLPPGFWARLPARSRQEAAPGDGELHIAGEIRCALEHGVAPATPPALLLLAGLALRHEGPHEDALRLARTALALAARLGIAEDGRLAALHAGLVTPLAAGFGQAACELVALTESAAAPRTAALCLAGTGLVAGLPLPELARRLEMAARTPAAFDDMAAASELAARAHLAGVLLHGDSGLPQGLPAGAAQRRFGHWLALLQSAWYAQALPQALQAAGRLDKLLRPAVPLADRLCHHLFAALALSRADGAATARQLDVHCTALRRLAPCSSDAASMATLALAARAQREGDALAALRGFELAGEAAGREERHWLAALAWEGAATQASSAGLASGVRHYRRAALASYGYWGALGRIDTLRRRWQDPELAPGDGRANTMLRSCGVGELGLSIAHEVNQPLAAIALHAAAARKWLRRPEPDIERALSSIALIGDAGRHAGDIVRSMQRLVSRAGNELGTVAVDSTIGEVLLLLQHRLCQDGVHVELALGLGGACIHANRTQVQQVLTNLLVNAIDALGSAPADPKRIRIASRRTGGQVEITVTDNGPGIAPHHRERVFGSLFSTKPHGTGMGLAISLAIVRAHGGELGFEPAEPRGACFRLRLPLDAAAALPQTAGVFTEPHQNP
ncbi:MAG: ATP-binding protein [Pseudomonadota bacterium]